MKTFCELYEEYHGGTWGVSEETHKIVLASMTEAERISWKILKDITDRRGWSQSWDSFDDEIKDEIFAQFVTIIDEEISQ